MVDVPRHLQQSVRRHIHYPHWHTAFTVAFSDFRKSVHLGRWLAWPVLISFKAVFFRVVACVAV